MRQQSFFATIAAAAAMVVSSAAWCATASPGGEASLIKQLNSQGYIDVSAYKADSNGGASAKAIKAATGALVSVHVGAAGKINVSPNWPPQNPWKPS